MIATRLCLWADGGGTGGLVNWAKEKIALTLDVVKRTDDMEGFVVLPRRWVVRRTFAWTAQGGPQRKEHGGHPTPGTAAPRVAGVQPVARSDSRA